jgi:hypothetical protein
VYLNTRDGSVIKLRAPKGAVAATYPPSEMADMLQGQEEATVPVDAGFDALRVAVLPPYLRNPAGRTVFGVAEWGPLPWAVGTLGLLIGATLGEKLVAGGTALVGRAVAGLRPRRQAPPKKRRNKSRKRR